MPAINNSTAYSDMQPRFDQALIDIIDYVYHHDIDNSKSEGLERARMALSDALGCVFETLNGSDEARSIIEPVAPGFLFPMGFKLPGTAFRLDHVKGAFDLGTLIRYLDHNDAFPGAEWGHPSDNISVILAVADFFNRAVEPPISQPTTLKEVVTALIKAYEIQGTLQALNAFNKHDLDHTILVRIGFTAVVCHLLSCTNP